MKNKIKKRNISEVGVEFVNKKAKKTKTNLDGVNTVIKTNLTKPPQVDNDTVPKKIKKAKKKNLKSEKLNAEKAESTVVEDGTCNASKIPNEQTLSKEKLKEMKLKQLKREKRKQSRKEHGQYKVSDTVSVEALRQKIDEIQSRENISKTAKRKLRIFKKKLQIAEGTVSIPPQKNVNEESKINKLTKSQKKKLKREKLNLQSENELKSKQKESPSKEDVDSDKSGMKLEKKNKLKQKTAVARMNLKIDDDDDNDEIARTESSSDDDNLKETNSLIEKNEEESLEKDTSDSNVEKSDDDAEGNSSSDEIEEKEENNIKELKKKDIKIMKKSPKNENRKMSKQENTEKKKRYVLFVGNIPYQSTVEDLKQHFLQKVSNVASVRIPTMKGSKKPRGFAYVEVTNNTDYEKGLSLHNTNLQGFKIKVEYTQTGSKNIKNKQELVAKNKRLHALRKKGKLAGSNKKNSERNVRRKKMKIQAQEE